MLFAISVLALFPSLIACALVQNHRAGNSSCEAVSLTPRKNIDYVLSLSGTYTVKARVFIYLGVCKVGCLLALAKTWETIWW